MNGFDAIVWLARVGFLVKGVLYMVIGALALQVAAKAGGRVTGTRGALTTVLGQPFGRTLQLVIVVGLLSYATWRILQGLLDPDRLGNNWRGLAIRASFVARGALHAVLGWQAFRLYTGLSAASGTSEREVATEAFRWPLGDWLVVLAGLGLIGFAVQQVYAAITCRLERNLNVEEMRREAGEWAVGLSRFGVAARAGVFALLGWAIVVAGWARDPSEVGTTASSSHARCTTGRARPLASRRDGSRVRGLRLLRDHPRPLSTDPTRPVEDATLEVLRRARLLLRRF